MFSVIWLFLAIGGTYYYLARTGKSGIMKVPLAYAYIWFLKKRIAPLFTFEWDSKDPEINGILPQKEAIIREAPRELSSNINAADEIRISGLNKAGDFLFVRLSRRHDRCSELTVHLKLATGEEFQHPSHPDTLVYNTNGTTFSAGGLTLELIEALRKWRVVYKGTLRNKDGNDVMVQFHYIWHPINNYVEFPHDFNTEYLAGELASKDWSKDFSIPEHLKSVEWYAQFGQLHGVVNIEGKEEIEMLIRGLKTRKTGILNWKTMSTRLSFEGLLHNGTNFHIFVDANEPKNKETKYMYGYVCPPSNMSVDHITKFNFGIKEFYDAILNFSQDELSFEADKNTYKLKLKCIESEFNTFGGEDWNSTVTLKNIHFTLNDKPGNGFIHHIGPNDIICPFPQRKSLPQLREPDIKDSPKLVLSLKERECQSSAVVGGKGASLALMSTLAECEDKFTVPKGICITKTAFSRHLQENLNLEPLIDKLYKVAWTQIEGSISDECEKLTKAVCASEILGSLKKEIKSKLFEEFGENFEILRFAVRSSAIGEDGQEMSAAGQNETFLGVKGFYQICESLLKCWASQFAFRSIEYKRQNGQLLYNGMGVVIQEMVPADVAGVLFTRDPISGSSAKMFITANYGLGESVVSASADPDTIILKRTWDDKLSIISEEIGKKSVMISMSDDGGTVETEIAPDRATKCTVTSDLAHKLCKIAIYLEQVFGSARDIEWAIKGSHIFLLQSRPVTTEHEMIDFEIMHEFDSIMRTDEEYFSTANVGEVMPGAMCPLQIGTVFRALIPTFQKNISWKVDKYRFDPTVDEFLSIFYCHSFVDRIMQKGWTLEKKKGAVAKAWEIGIYGRLLDDDHVLEKALERLNIKAPLRKRMQLGILGIQGALFWKRILKDMEKQFWNRPLVTDNCKTAAEASTEVIKPLTVMMAAMMSHMKVSVSSTIWNHIVLNMLSSGVSDFSGDHYSDFATIIGSANGVESGDVPFSLRELAAVISKEIEPDVFCKMTLKEGLQWLQENQGESKKQFDRFLERHGHRGIKEVDISSVSWSRNPEGIIEVLQGIVGNLSAYKTPSAESYQNVLNNMKTQLTPFKRYIFPWIMKQCRQAVRGREKAKSLVVKACDHTRSEYRVLADLMVKEGFLPDPNLIFFITHAEIVELFKTRSPIILRRAKHRRRLHPQMDRLKFPEVCDGFPKPIDENDISAFVGETQVTGYPVSHGIIKASARIVKSFLDVNTIKPGEILITYSTDIGWSPYFPMLAGVVTEIGGLISHGAVVAREFGLPCIVGAQNATKVFKTGDIVLLNATKGIISKVEEN